MEYVLATGDEGARRLRLLARAAWPSTRALLGRLDLRPGLRCLDVGCGIGMVSRELQRRTGFCLGVDREAGFLARARGATYRQLEAHRLEVLGERFDRVYARYLLSHQPDPQEVLRQMALVTAPGGMVAVEDVDFPGHVWDPDCPALARYVELYQAVVRRRGGNPCLGRSLGRLLRQAGLSRVRHRAVLRLSGRRLARLTLAQVAAPLLAEGLTTPAELEELLAELAAYRGMVSVAPTFQAYGFKER